MRKWLIVTLAVVFFGCSEYEPQYTGPPEPEPLGSLSNPIILIWPTPELPDPNGKYYIEEWDNPYHRMPWWLDKYRFYRKLVVGDNPAILGGIRPGALVRAARK